MSLPSLAALLASIGCDHALNEAVMRPGQERHNLVVFLIERLVRPAALGQVLSRLDELYPLPRLAEEERQAQRLVTLLRQLGLSTTADSIRGCTTSSDSLGLLHKLASLVQLKDGPARATSQSQDQDPQQPQQQPQQQEHLAAYAPLLDFACANFTQLTAESSQLFPSDITKATARNSVHADVILSSSDQWASGFSERIPALRGDVQTLSDQVSTSDQDTWQRLLSELTDSLQQYLGTMGAFSDVYAKELSVWCESLPAAQTHGLGQQASSMLAAYQQASSVLESIKTIRAMHQAITASKPPLAAYQPQALLKIAEGARREAAKLSKQVEVLQTAIHLQGPLPQSMTMAQHQPQLQQCAETAGPQQTAFTIAMELD